MQSLSICIRYFLRKNHFEKISHKNKQFFFKLVFILQLHITFFISIFFISCLVVYNKWLINISIFVVVESTRSLVYNVNMVSSVYIALFFTQTLFHSLSLSLSRSLSHLCHFFIIHEILS